MGIKPPDELGAWCCYQCHQFVDGHAPLPGYTKEQIRLAHAEGCLRTAVERKRD
jgi:hypothetical protein